MFKYLKNKEKIKVKDFGAGSRVFKSNNREIKKIAKNVLKKPKYSRILFKIIRKNKAKYILELGTSLGLTTQYLAKANSKDLIYSLEGCPETIKVAKKGFEKNKISNIKVIEGNFDDSLPKLLSLIPQIDFAFIDGNHQRVPTEKYFISLLEKAHSETVLVFDDIHWSEEMEEAWETIKNHFRVTATIDLYSIGIVFFKQGLSKQHFTIKY